MSDLVPLPRFDGSSLLNLVATLERRLTGSAPALDLRADLAERLPEAATYVLVLFDGLGAHQLDHPSARELADDLIDPIDAMFPTTTTVNLSTVATGLAPVAHGTIGHHMWIPELATVVNVLKWIIPGAGPAAYDTTAMLPSPNLWERLRAAGIEPITVQPGAFESTPLSRALYRGCRIEPVWTERELVNATVDLAAQPRRLIFTYLPHVDVAAHLFGQRSQQYAAALSTAAGAWRDIRRGLPPHAVAVGTADHGHLDYSPADKHLIRGRPDAFGDPRSLYLRDDPPDDLPGRWYPLADMLSWLGPGAEHPQLRERLPAGVMLADRGDLLIPSTMDLRLVGYHGGLEPEEVQIPFLVANPS